MLRYSIVAPLGLTETIVRPLTSSRAVTSTPSIKKAWPGDTKRSREGASEPSAFRLISTGQTMTGQRRSQLAYRWRPIHLIGFAVPEWVVTRSPIASVSTAQSPDGVRIAVPLRKHTGAAVMQPSLSQSLGEHGARLRPNVSRQDVMVSRDGLM